jgi:hypothetical protein
MTNVARPMQLNQRAYVVREDQTGIMNQLFSFLDVIPEGVIDLNKETFCL